MGHTKVVLVHYNDFCVYNLLIANYNYLNSHHNDPAEYMYYIAKQHNSTHSCAGPTSTFCVWVTPSVQGTSPTLTVTWQALASGAVTYTVKYSTEAGEVNTPPVGALKVTGISGTSTILTALERGTTYYIWVVGVSEGGEGPHSDRTRGVTSDSELDSINIGLQ